MRNCLAMPRMLVADPAIPPICKALYATMLCECPCTIQTLSGAFGLHRNTVRRLVRTLTSFGWAVLEGGRNRKLIYTSAPLEQQKAIAWRLTEHRSLMPYIGEGLTKRILDICVDDDDYVDNARPWFLPNKNTEEPLEIDRLYVGAAVGVEYNGAQHSQITKLTPDATKLAEQRARDVHKAELCKERGITLLSIGEDDLSVERVLAMLPPRLSKVHINLNDLHIRTLDNLCGQHLANCRKYRTREASASRKNAQRTLGRGADWESDKSL